MVPVTVAPHSPVGPRRASVAGSLECIVMGPITWSYHPSESSYAMMTPILLHVGRFSKELIVFTRKVCSSSGSELSGVSVLVLRSLQEANRWEVPLIGRDPEAAE